MTGAARSMMTMRATVERRGASPGTDEFNQPIPGPWETRHAALPCHVWATLARQAADAERVVTVEDRRMICPLRTDIKSGDRVTQVADRRGRVIHGRTLRVEAVHPRATHVVALLGGEQ